jgi:hypothetical protein
MRIANDTALTGHTAPKILRHQFATALQEGRVDPLVRNLLMGHAAANEQSAGHGLGMTAIYTHTRPETIRQQLASALADRPAVIAIRNRLRRQALLNGANIDSSACPNGRAVFQQRSNEDVE